MASLTVTALLVSFAVCSNCYKILFYCPKNGHSHVTYMGKIADTLVTAGHDVVFYLPEIDSDVKTNGSKLARLLHRKRDFDVPRSVKRMVDTAWSKKGESFVEVFETVRRITDVQTVLCEKQLEDESLLETLKAEKFDLGISEATYFCGVTLFEKIGLKKYISTFAVVLMEGMTESFGVSNNPSYVPTMFSSNSDVMAYAGRVKNFLSYMASNIFIRFYGKPHFSKAMAKYFGAQFDLLEILTRSAFVFVNADEFLEFPRPISHKIVYIGGIAVPERKPLDEEFARIMDFSKEGAVLISFGSIAKSSLMSNDTKMAFVELFRKYPKINFIWKYEENDEVAAELPNVFKRKWVPQNDLLNHPNMRVFISHGGLNSMTETAHAGIPVICVPLFSDQMRNAKMVEKRGVGIILDKHTLDTTNLLAAFEKIFSAPRYLESAQRLAKMIARKPVSVQDRVIKYVEFAAQFGDADNLDTAARKLNFFQYYLLDIVLPFIFISYLFSYALLKLVLLLVRQILRLRKTKKE